MQKTTIFYGLSTLFMVLIIWQISVSLFDVNPILFPSPLEVLSAFYDSPEIYSDIIISMIRLVIGSIIGISLAVFFGVLTGHISVMDKTLGNMWNFLRFIPPLALVPLFLLWLGIGEFSKIGLLAWTSFFPTWISVHAGVKGLENKYLLVAKSLSVKKTWFLKEIVFKGSTNYIVNGARVGVGFAFSVLVAAEMLGAFAGVGYRISFLQSVYRIDRMIGYIIILGAIGLIFDRLFMGLSKHFTPWKNEPKN
ncbi:ABC transporter permease [Candidatus Woesearchaeota archaeon]|nr:ABC transporter permease [Candidatus Woesearchaeota archaeon]